MDTDDMGEDILSDSEPALRPCIPSNDIFASRNLCARSQISRGDN